MARREIIWTQKANAERRDILQFWIDRNKSKMFSIKLNKLFIQTLLQLSENPYIGRITDFENVRVKLVRNYLLFYEFTDTHLKVLSVWDGRRNENSRAE